MNDVNPLLREAFSALDRTGVRWCLLRGRETLLSPAGDVDLLIHPHDVVPARDAIVRSGFVPLRVWSRGSQNFFLGYESTADVWLDLHAVADLSFGPFYRLRTRAATDILNRCIRVDGVPMPAESDRFWVTILHALLDKGEIRVKHRTALQALLPSVETKGELPEICERFAPGGALGVLECVKREDWNALERIAPQITGAWNRADPRARWRELGNRASLLVAKAREPLARPGINVALLAPDGAGKTTLSDSLASACHFPVRRFYLGLEGGRFGGAGPSAIPGLGFLQRLFMLWKSYALARYHQARRRFVLFDRYPYEALVARARTSSRLSRARQYLLGHALPPPDLLVILDAPAQTLYERAHEHDEVRLEQDRQGYLNLAQRVPQSVVVDATQSPSEVKRATVTEIWRVYRTRVVSE